jgi:hypothetical protein
VNCETCGNEIDLEASDKSIGEVVHEEVELRLTCSKCKQGYYAYLAVEEFVVDEAKPGTLNEEPA